VYQPRLNKVAYSSILTGKWDPMGGDGGNNITLSGVCPVKDGVIVVGWQERDAATGAPRGNPMPTANIPTWGRPAPSGEEAVIAKMVFDTPVQ
jgi:hypothetical protein